MSGELERLVKRRNQALALSLVGYLVWTDSGIFRDAAPGHPWLKAVVAVGLVGWVAWTVGLFLILRITVDLRGRPQLAAAFNDERVQANRARAAYVSAVAMMLVNGLAVAALSFNRNLFSGFLLAQLTIMTGVTTFLGAFLQRETAPDVGAEG